MVRSCSYCKKICSNEKGRSAHVFPKNELLRDKWMKACKFEAHDKNNFKNLKLCSDHFSKSCFRITSETYPKAYLKPDAVPTIFDYKKKMRSTLVDKRSNVLVPSDKLNKANIDDKTVGELNHEILPNAKRSLIKSSEPISKIQVTQPEIRVFEPEIEVSQPEIPTPQPEIEASQPKIQASQPEAQVSRPKRKIWGPRTALQMSVENFDTPKKIALNLQLIRNEVAKKNKLINSLKLKNYRLRKTVDNQSTLIQHLQSKELICNKSPTSLVKITPDYLTFKVKRTKK